MHARGCVAVLAIGLLARLTPAWPQELGGGEDTAAAHGKLGLSLYQSGRFEEAITELGRAAQLEPASAEYSLKLAAAILGQKRYPVALEFLKAVAKRFDALAEYQYNLGLAYYGMRDYPNAASAFEKTTKTAPRMDLAYFFLGNTYAVSGDLEKGVPYYRRALEINPAHPGYYLALGKVLAGIGPDHDPEAIVLFRKALQLRPGDTPNEYALASACMRREDFACARPLLERIVRQYPEELSPHVLLSRLYARVKEPAKAEVERETVKRLQKQAQGKNIDSGINSEALSTAP